MTAEPPPSASAGPRFVGRVDELRDLLDALGPRSRAVVHCSSPGGVGKTTLLRRLAVQARNHGVKVLELDARDLDPSPEAIEAAIVRAAGASRSRSAVEAITAAAPGLLLIDTVEAIGATLPWIFCELLEALPPGVVTVLASRDPLDARWRTDLEWAPRLRLVSLRNLGPRESSELLAGYGIDPADHDEIFAFTLGHPLALTLIAESMRASGSRFAHLSTGNVVHELVLRFTRDIGEPLQRRALEAACVVRVVTEPTLRALLEIDNSYALFRWLRELPFFETVHDGLRPHENVRRAVVEDLRFRDPEWYEGLRDRAHAHFEALALRLDPRDEVQQIARLYDLSFLHSQNPVAQRFFDWSANQPLFAAQPTARDIPGLEDVIRRFEGPAAVQWFRYWLERQPEHCHVFRDQALEVVGYHCAPVLTAAGLEAARADPAIAGAIEATARHGPLRGSEVAVVTRFWLCATRHQAVGPVQSRLWLHMVRTYGLTPHLAYAITTFADVDFWEPIFVYMGFSRAPAGDYRVGDRRFGVMMHDWRARSYRDWLELMARRQTSVAPLPAADTPPPPAVLDRETFARAVKEALRQRGDARTLGRNPLLDTRLVRGDLSPDAPLDERVARLRAQLDEVCATLAESDKHDKQARAVMAAYGRGAPSQEAAAEALGMPLSTFRRHLKRGVELLVERLWEREIGPGSG